MSAECDTRNTAVEWPVQSATSRMVAPGPDLTRTAGGKVPRMVVHSTSAGGPAEGSQGQARSSAERAAPGSPQ